MRQILLAVAVASSASCASAIRSKPDTLPVSAPLTFQVKSPAAQPRKTFFSKYEGGSCMLEGNPFKGDTLTIRRDGYDTAVSMNVPLHVLATVSGRTFHTKFHVSGDPAGEVKDVNCTQDQVSVLFSDRIDFYGAPRTLINHPDFYASASLPGSAVCATFIDSQPTVASVDEYGNFSLIQFPANGKPLPMVYSSASVKPITTCSISSEKDGSVYVSIPEKRLGYSLQYDENEGVWGVVTETSGR